MSTSGMRDERRRRLVLRPSSRNVSLSHSRMTGSRRSLGAGSKVLDKSSMPMPRKPVRVFDEEQNDVTPQPLHQGECGAGPPKGSRFFLDEISAGLSLDQMTTTGSSFSLPFSRSILSSSKFSSQSSIDSVGLETEEGFSKRDPPLHLPDQGKKVVVKEEVKEEVTEAALCEQTDVFLSETDTVSLLDLPSRCVSTENTDAHSITERNKRYTEVCRTRAGTEMNSDRAAQTLVSPFKNKLIQSDSISTRDTGTFVSTWEMFDSLRVPEEAAEASEGLQPAVTQSDLQGAEQLLSSRAEHSTSVESSSGTVSESSSMKDLEALELSVRESELTLLLSSPSFHYSLRVMERSLAGNNFQQRLAAFRGLPALTDPSSALPSEQEGAQEPPESEASAPALVHLWSFSCDLTQGRRVNSMVWNKKNPDLLAVGYGSSVSSSTPGLVCCWSLRNPTWPDTVIPCDCAVTALDFSLKSPGQLGVGLEDGTVMICGVHRSSSSSNGSSNSSSSILNSRCCNHKHMEPVLQLRWTLQDVSLRDDQQEALVSVATDGRVCKWFVSNSGLDCTDMMKLKRVKSAKRNAADNTEETKLESMLSALTPGMCFDFHPKESGVYLVGTWEGLIHKCSSSNSQQFTDTYKKHSGPVLGVSWSPLCPGLFLSCSSDWSLKLWREERSGPVLVLSSPHRAVLDSCWSPRSATVIGAVSEAQLEIWDLQHSILDPLLVLPAPPSVSFTSLLFSPHSDCAVAGDSGGQVWVHLLHNVYSEGPGTQAEALDDIIHASVSK